MTTGAQLKEEGIELVLSNDNAMWIATCVGLYRSYMSRHPQGFTAEQCKVYALNNGLLEPHHPNTWGAVWSGIARSKAIEKTGYYVKSELIARHANEVPVWRITNQF